MTKLKYLPLHYTLDLMTEAECQWGLWELFGLVQSFHR